MSAVALPGLQLAGEPRAQLLPASVRQREKNRSARRLMVMLIVLSVVIAGAGIAWGFLRQMTAQQALEAAQVRTAEILAQQGEYADAARIAQLVADSEEAQRVATSTEVQWAALVAAIAPYVPADTLWSGIALQAPAPWEPGLVPEGPLRQPRVAVVTLEFSGTTYAPAAVFVEAIPAIYGFSDVKIDKVELKDGLYVTTVKLTLDADALSQRFAEEPDAEGSAAGDEPATEDDATVAAAPGTEGGQR